MTTAPQQSQEGTLSRANLAAELLYACPDAVLVTDTSGKVLYANRAAVGLSGYSPDELVGRNLTSLISRGMRHWLMETAREVEQLGKVSCMPTKARRQDGSALPIEVSVSKVNSGEEVVYLIVARDTSGRIQLTKEALQAERLRALGEIASGVAHDFRNVLAAILGRTQLLLMKTSDPQTRRALETIERPALNGGETVKRIMRYAKAQDREAQFVPLDPNVLLEEVAEATRFRWQHEAQRDGKAITLEWDLTPLPAVEADPAELHQFFANLIMNACDAMPEGGKITIATRSSPTTVTVSISDTGHGMTKETQQRIFDSFFTTKGSESLGLGLAIGKEAIQRHGGQITVGSAVAEGTTFTITLPRSDKSFAPAAAPPRPISVGEPAQVLVVDDDPILREMLLESIAELDHRPTAASCGEEAMQLLNLSQYDVVITDLGMPGIPGSKVAQAAKQASAETYVILLTGWDNPLRGRAGRYIDEVITKPVTITDLGAAISRGLAS